MEVIGLTHVEGGGDIERRCPSKLSYSWTKAPCGRLAKRLTKEKKKGSLETVLRKRRL